MKSYIIAYDLDKTDDDKYEEIIEDIYNLASIEDGFHKHLKIQKSVHIIKTDKFKAKNIIEKLCKYITGEGSSLFVRELGDDSDSTGLNEQYSKWLKTLF